MSIYDKWRKYLGQRVTSATSPDDLDERLRQLSALLDEHSRPNINSLQKIAKDLESIKLTIKFFGYELARDLAASVPPREPTGARNVGLKSKASTQADLESDWAAHWIAELKVPLVFHRKLWELAYVLQALHEHRLLASGMRGLGFGCGKEPIPSYLASRGVSIVVTDLPPDDSRAKGWAASNQLTHSLAQAYHPHLIDKSTFDSQVSLRFVDMNAIPTDLRDFDFCWSICALEHLGSIKHGLDFIEASLTTLRPGGLAVHTTEFNFFDDDKTIDNWGTVLFQRKHFSELHDRLRAKGHHVAALDFDVGSKPMDKFIDIPPFVHDWNDNQRDQWGAGHAHLKVSVDGFPSTCFGVIVRKVGYEA